MVRKSFLFKLLTAFYYRDWHIYETDQYILLYLLLLDWGESFISLTVNKFIYEVMMAPSTFK